MLSRRRRIVVSVLVVLAVVALASRAFVAKESPEAQYRTEPVSRGPLVASVTATGTVNPVKTVQVGTYVSGPVQAIDADFNSPVTRGQRVAKIDPRPFELRVRQAEAALANTRARLVKTRADLDYKTRNLARNRRLASEGIVAEDLIDTTESGVAQARADLALQEAEVRQAQAQLEEAQVNLGYTDIVSPVDGVVVSRNIDVGQTVAASFQTPVLFLIAEDLTKMQVNANVSESDIGAAREGQSTTFSVDAYPDRTFAGTVVQVRNAPLNVQNVITYDVVIAADNTDLALRPGMTANVEIVTGRRNDVLRIPTAALRFRPPADEGRTATAASPSAGVAAPPSGGVAAPPSGGAQVWLLADGRPSPVAVETGLADESYTEVLSGPLAEGDRVIVATARSKAEPARTQPQPPGFAPRGPR
jgi:HlyD family secretion protein